MLFLKSGKRPFRDYTLHMNQMMISIQLIEELDDFYLLESLQRQIWNLPQDSEIIPAHLLITFQANGGLVLGAWMDEQLIGLCVGFVGHTADQQLKFCSEIMGVLPGYQNQQIGYQLKCTQRDMVLQRDIHHITWTYDPLQTRNGYLNLHKLGATCQTFYPNLYGNIGGINAGVDSDRFQVDWWIDSDHVQARLRGNPTPSLAACRASGVPVVHGLHDQKRPLSPQFLLQVPDNFPELKQADLPLAQAWRTQSSTHFQAAFAEGYTATDLLRDENGCYYLLEHQEKRP